VKIRPQNVEILSLSQIYRKKFTRASNLNLIYFIVVGENQRKKCQTNLDIGVIDAVTL